MTRVGAGEALAAAGLVMAGVSLMHETGPGFGTALRSRPDDDDVRRQLTGAELTTTATLVTAAAVAAVLIRATWPLVVAGIALAVAVSVHELALRAGG